MRHLLLFFALVCTLFLYGQSPSTFLNEINYLAADPSGRGFEIAGNAGADLSGFSAVHYTADGTVDYVTYLGQALIPSQQNGYGTVWYEVDQMGGNGGLALVNPSGNVVQFVAYGLLDGSTLLKGAVEGAAQGMHPEYLGFALPNTSLQLIGTGISYLDFFWIPEQSPSTGSVNEDQLFLSSVFGVQSANDAATSFNALDIKEKDTVSWQVFPNPAREYIRLELRDKLNAQPVTITLTTAQGQRLKQLSFNQVDQQLQINVVDLPAGHYFLTVDSPNSRYTQMIILE